MFVVVTWPSRSGNLPLLILIGTLDKPISGRVFIDGGDLGGMKDGELTQLRRHTIGFIFQFHNLIPVLTALENVQLPLQTAKVKNHVANERAITLLSRVGVSEGLNPLPAEL